VLTAAEATTAILSAMPALGTGPVRLDEATGRVLRQDICAERDQPPFDRVMMDGIALRYDDFKSGQRRFPMQATQAAGDPAEELESGKAIEIMTGASLPGNADCIVPVERLHVDDGVATIEDDYAATQFQFIHPRGSDHAEGAYLLSPGVTISPMDVAVIASSGLTDIEVTRSPTVTVISTGNELVAGGKPIEPHQIRMSNGPAIVAMLGVHGYEDSQHDHIADEPALLEKHIGEHLESSDVLVLSGGVSMGKADYVPSVLKKLGVEVVFHKISQRPGKPMWFGMGKGGKAVFALPGNPVSALVCCRQYVIPALHHASGRRPVNPEFSALSQDVQFRPQLTCFMPVNLVSNAAGQTLAMPVHTNTSGDFTSLSGTSGYVELPLEETLFKAGAVLRLRRWLP
jgi:molybdopterin molybdotransferase